MEKKQKEVKRTRYQKVSKNPTQDINDKEVIMNTRKRSPDKYQQPQQTHSNIRASNQVFTEKAVKENKLSSKSINSISHPLQRNMKAKPAKEDSQSSSPIEDSDNNLAFDYRINYRRRNRGFVTYFIIFFRSSFGNDISSYTAT